MANVTVSPTLKNMIPAVLIDYLWELAMCENCEKQVFTLEAAELGGRDVQDIYQRPTSSRADYHRVFGFEPVNCQVEVMHDTDSYSMQLGG